jgi:hypothetical protein
MAPRFADANQRLHAPSEVVSEPERNGAPSYASRSATKMYLIYSASTPWTCFGVRCDRTLQNRYSPVRLRPAPRRHEGTGARAVLLTLV